MHNYVYSNYKNKAWFIAEDLDIIFFIDDKSAFKLDPKPLTKPSARALATSSPLKILPNVVDICFRLISSMLENRKNKFAAEYTKQKSNLSAGDGTIPDFYVIRDIILDGPPKEKETALKICFRVFKFDKIKGFCYYIDYIDLHYSSAKPTRSHQTFDYTIELKPTLLIDGSKKVQELSPLVISSIGIGKTSYDAQPFKQRTDIIPLPDGATLTEISIKVIESNPVKIRVEKILSIWNNNKDSVKTIINNFLPKEKEKEKGDEKIKIQNRLISTNEIKYISVLNSDLDKDPWVAIQANNSFAAIMADPYYNENYTWSPSRSSDDKKLKEKPVEEITTHAQGTATVIELS
jgi:hypothetical protein